MKGFESIGRKGSEKLIPCDFNLAPLSPKQYPRLRTGRRKERMTGSVIVLDISGREGPRVDTQRVQSRGENGRKTRVAYR